MNSVINFNQHFELLSVNILDSGFLSNKFLFKYLRIKSDQLNPHFRISLKIQYIIIPRKPRKMLPALSHFDLSRFSEAV